MTAVISHLDTPEYSPLIVHFILSNWLGVIHYITLAAIKLVILILIFPLIIIFLCFHIPLFLSERDSCLSLSISMVTILVINTDYEEHLNKCLFCEKRIHGRKNFKFPDC